MNAVPDVEVLAATAADKTAIGHLFELYQYDFSEFTDEDVNGDGVFGYPLLDTWWTEADQHPFLIRCAGHIAGFAMVRSGRPHDMAQFFVLRKYRRHGVGLLAARAVFAKFPGEWQVRELAANTRATAFWRTAIPAPFIEDTNDMGPVQHFHVE
jgi:predicted acetyltransferase